VKCAANCDLKGWEKWRGWYSISTFESVEKPTRMDKK